MTLSPFAPKHYPELPVIRGITLASAACGIKYKNRADVCLMLCPENTAIAGTLTKSTTASANIAWARDILPHGKVRAILVNSGNANAFNGRHGEESVERIVNHSAKILGCDTKEIYPSSTGVIGEPLPDHLITNTLESLANSATENNWLNAAKAIMTTDTFPKLASRSCEIDGRTVTINGIAKGSGMIAPNMATMLAYFFTDLAIDQILLQDIFSDAVNRSFNRITVDSDTSTSDTALIAATGTAKNSIITQKNDPRLAVFSRILDEITLELAHQIIKDGEGITKFITVNVSGAINETSATKIAFSIANSPLVKTAIAGEDANWGRIVMAIGKTEEPVIREKIAIAVGGHAIVGDGELNSDYEEQKVTDHMKGSNIIIDVDLGQGKGQSTVWTCDLTHEYISINADYRS